MHEIFDKVTEFIWGVWRYRWTALITAWACALLGWIMVAQIDARYPATARLFVDTNRILEPLLDGIAVQPNVKQRVALMSKTLLSRPNLELLIDKHSLDQTPKGPVNRESLIETLSEEITIEDTNNSQSIYSLSYSHQDPETAKAVVQSIIDIFITSSLDEERTDNRTTQQFLDKQISDYESRLTAAEQRLAEFKRKHAGSLPGEAGGYYKRMENLVGLQRTAQLELQEAVNRRNTLRRNLAQEERKIVSSSANKTPYDARIAELQAQLDELLVRFTDRHPQVSILKQSIDDLRQKKLSGVGGSSSNSTALLQKSVVYQKLSTLLAEAEAKVSQLRARDSNYQTRLSTLRGTVDSIPEVEAELKQLDRDYETVRSQHETLLNKREAARLTGNIEKDSNDVKIRPLDPPFVPSRPTDPDRLLLNVLTLIGSVGAGVMVAFFLAVLHPVFYNQRALEHLTQIPVLGSVSLSRKPTERFAAVMKHLNFSLLTVLLPIVCVAVLYVQIKNDNLYESLKFVSANEPEVLAINELE
ncbi:hypothetical protein AB833_20555 [Chromatiales bacterium (ex Bugula neritina AB1)]|nr:hypothetical protein AB833_20555 [Chromatiales bacterium (ex Bugula neritina AB1)]